MNIQYLTKTKFKLSTKTRIVGTIRASKIKVEADGGGPGGKRCLHPNLFNENRGSTGKYCVKGVSKVCFKNCNLVAQSSRKLNGVSLVGSMDAWV